MRLISNFLLLVLANQGLNFLILDLQDSLQFLDFFNQHSDLVIGLVPDVVGVGAVEELEFALQTGDFVLSVDLERGNSQP